MSNATTTGPGVAAKPRMLTLVLLTALSTLSLNLFLPSLSNIAQSFETDYALASLSISALDAPILSSRS